jgi:hypothetical protein
VIASLFLAFVLGCSDPNEPRAITYDHVACDHCEMLVSDRRFAVQLVEQDGRLRTFDDPACAFDYIAEETPHIGHLWFHDSTTDAEVWLDWHQVSFVPAEGAPMDGGLAAVPIGTTGAISFSEASSRALTRGAK